MNFLVSTEILQISRSPTALHPFHPAALFCKLRSLRKMSCTLEDLNMSMRTRFI